MESAYVGGSHITGVGLVILASCKPTRKRGKRVVSMVECMLPGVSRRSPGGGGSCRE